jgi:uncharacterized protein (TIGR03000 family)
MVLMAALTSGGTAPDCFFRCHQGHHSGGYSTACYGGGCYGGGCYGGGCYGGGYGCAGGSCYGGWGSCGGGYGGGCYGTCAGGWGIHGYGAYGCHGCYGCYGCAGCIGFAPGYQPTAGSGAFIPRERDDTLPLPKKDENGSQSSAPTKARLIVEIPTDATLSIDNKVVKVTDGKRTFTTPTLVKGQTYYYDLTVEVVREGKPLAETRRILVRAGEETRADFTDVGAVSTAKAK